MPSAVSWEKNSMIPSVTQPYKMKMPEAFSLELPLTAVQVRIEEENAGAIFIGTSNDCRGVEKKGGKWTEPFWHENRIRGFHLGECDEGVSYAFHRYSL